MGRSLIPLLLYGKLEEVPAATPFGQCLAKDLKASGRFEDVQYFNDWSKLQDRIGDFDLIVTGRLNEDSASMNMLTYGITIIGASLPLTFSAFLLPMGTTDRTVSFDVVYHAARNPWDKVHTTPVGFHQGTYLVNVWALLTGANYTRDHYASCPDENLQPAFLQIGNELSAYAGTSLPLKTISDSTKSRGDLR